jgi:cytidine deaminase
MKLLEIQIPIQVVEYAELTDLEKNLVEQARKATFRSYAPYSKFSVGAAIALDNGTVVTGANQENAAFPSGTCAERSACFYAHAQYPEAKFKAIAIAARNNTGNEVEMPISPCGSCRQALLEYETLAGHNIEVILAGAKEIYKVQSIKALLPLAFTEF